jgi:hypothetical protein
VDYVLAAAETAGAVGHDHALQAGKAPRGNAAPAAPAPPKPRQVIRWIMTRPDRLDAADATRLAQITARSPELKATAAHVREFAAMMTGRQGHRLDEWITSVRADPRPHSTPSPAASNATTPPSWPGSP